MCGRIIGERQNTFALKNPVPIWSIDLWQTKDKQNIEVAMCPVRHNNSTRRNNEIHVLTARKVLHSLLLVNCQYTCLLLGRYYTVSCLSTVNTRAHCSKGTTQSLACQLSIHVLTARKVLHSLLLVNCQYTCSLLGGYYTVSCLSTVNTCAHCSEGTTQSPACQLSIRLPFKIYIPYIYCKKSI